MHAVCTVRQGLHLMHSGRGGFQAKDSCAPRTSLMVPSMVSAPWDYGTSSMGRHTSEPAGAALQLQGAELEAAVQAMVSKVCPY